MPALLSPRAILDRLVAFPTVSDQSNLDLVDWVAGYLADFGITAHRVFSEDGSKASLYAQVGPDLSGGVMLSGHSDVVPVAGQPWTSDPWVVTERAGRLYGRGTCDMKGFDALAIAAMVLAAQTPLARPLQFALSHDEEVGCTGAPAMIAAMAGHLPRAEAVVVGEPSRLRAVTGHKGSSAFSVHVRGYEVHSSLIDRGVSAIMRAAPLIDWANRMNAANRAATPGVMAAVFDPPYTTLHIGTIRGGTAQNIMAADCHFDMEIRVVPGDDLALWEQRFEAEVRDAEAAMRVVHPDCFISLGRAFSVPPLRPENNGAAEALVRRLTGDNGTHVVSYGTEAGQFQEAGYSAVVCGPGDIAQAHKADEYLEVAEFEAGWDFMQRLVAGLRA